MRVVGGMWRGRPLVAPTGRDVTRPTTDRVREATTSMVVSAVGLDMSDVRVLDAFAGSGALSIELLSRGAAHATLVEKNRRTAQVIRKNLEAVGATRQMANLVTGDVFALVGRGVLAGPYDVVLLDPPYAMSVGTVVDLVASLAKKGLLAAGALVVYERVQTTTELALAGFSLVTSKRYGSTCVDLLRMD